jgi:hypothetical protein
MIRDEEASLGQWKTREPAKWNACGEMGARSEGGEGYAI